MDLFYKLPYHKANEQLTVCGIPFDVHREGGVVRRVEGNHLLAGQYFETLYFLGMSTDLWLCSDWWGQTEVMYDTSIRLFFGDRIARIRLIFADRSEELISVIYGVNAFNYNLFFPVKAHEGDLRAFSGPYDEPFRSDPKARKLLDDALMMCENTEVSAEKLTKWVFAYKPRSDKEITKIEWFREDGKRADIMISAVTGLVAGQQDVTGIPACDQGFFLRRDWYRPVEALKRRVYQYLDEIPSSVDLLEIENFDAPDIRFYNACGLDLYTNVYRKNIMDMAYQKITDDGMTHTSSAMTANFGGYVGFGTFNVSDSYGSQIWTRDIGRMLIEVISMGYFDRAKMAVEKLHETLYYPSVRFQVPHWKRVANRIAVDENDLWNEGNENDGHASVMIAIYSLYRKGAVGKEWLEDNRKHLKAAADYFLWQEANPKESNFNGVLYSHSETSTQEYGGYDLYANTISAVALELYARLFDALGDCIYAGELRGLSGRIREGCKRYFLMEHDKYGKVWTDTTDDCWTYEYKRFADLILTSDYRCLDLFGTDADLFDIMTRTFAAEREVYYNPYSGRQMGYGQGYLTGATLMLDLVDEYTDCVNASANFCYHHTDYPYVVPEGVIRHGSGLYWYRNCDLGNAVQQAEIVKEARLMLGIDDFCAEALRIVPRLPKTMTVMEAYGLPVHTDEGVKKVNFRYERSSTLPLGASDGINTYSMFLDGDVKLEWVRFGPFIKDTVESNGTILKIEKIQERYYAYVKV